LERQVTFLQEVLPMWSVRLSDAQRDAVRALIEAQEEVGPSLVGALEALDLARWDDLPDARLDWDRVVELAKRQNIGEADVVWDLTGGAVASAKGTGRTAPKRPPGGKRPPARRRSA
jgi:hypothetical protein